MKRRGAVAVIMTMALLFLAGGTARAADETASLFAAGVKALEQSRPQDAVANFEALADRGVTDASASYDRGLAYAMRVRMGAEQPGDLGRAAQGFDEASALAADPTLRENAMRAAAAVRAEVARRKAREGTAVDMDQTDSPWRTLTHALPEDAWTYLALVGSLAVGVGLFMRWLGRSSRVRAAAAVTILAAVPSTVIFAALSRAARADRLYFRDAVVVVPEARPTDEHGIPVPGATALPEAARVEVLGTRAAWTEVRWGPTQTWIPSGALRPIARP